MDDKSRPQYSEADVGVVTQSEKHHEANIVASTGIFKSWLRTVEKANIESRGIERVEPEDRYDQSLFDGFTLWAGANFTASTFATGALGPLIGLGFWDSFTIILLVNFFSAMLIALFGTLGPLTGLRQIVISRFSFGVWGSRILVVFNLLSCIGWSAVNSIAGAQILHSVSNGRFPLWAGNLIIGIVAMVICIFGYRIIHIYERFSWIPQVIIFCILAGYGAKHFNVGAYPMGSGATEVGPATSFIAILYGFAAGWAAFAADYNVRMPENTNKFKLGAAIWGGAFIGMASTEILGAAFMTTLASDEKFGTAFGISGYGGIMSAALEPIGGFGKFLLVVMAISVVGCNIVNNYSLAFSAQNLGDWALKVPRFLWTVLGSIAYIVVAVAGEEQFVPVLESFLTIIGYYSSAYYAIILIEHFGFRRKRYPLDDWNNTSVTPFGFAAVASLAFGFVGAVLGMNQKWYQGVISQAVKPAGIEIGWIMSGLFSTIAFIPLRMLEKKFTRK